MKNRKVIGQAVNNLFFILLKRKISIKVYGVNLRVTCQPCSSTTHFVSVVLMSIVCQVLGVSEQGLSNKSLLGIKLLFMGLSRV